MRIFCSICKDIYTPDIEILITNCGHLYHNDCISRWCNQNKTCPQCRTQLKFPLLKVFFDIDKDTKIDPSTLEHQVEILTEKIRQSDLKNKKLKDENQKYEKLLIKLEQCIEGLKQKNDFLKSSVKSLKDQIVTYTKQLETVNKLKSEVEFLESRFASYKSLDIILNGTSEKAQKLLKITPVTEFGVKQLSIYVSALKDKTLKDEKRIEELIAEKKELLKVIDSEQKKLKNVLQENLNPKDSQKLKQSKPVIGKSENYTQKHIKSEANVTKPFFTVNIEFSDTVKKEVARTNNFNSSNCCKHWEDLVAAGPSRNIGSTLKKPKTNLNQSVKRLYENQGYAFDGMGGSKKISLGNSTPKEEFEKILKTKPKEKEILDNKNNKNNKLLSNKLGVGLRIEKK